MPIIRTTPSLDLPDTLDESVDRQIITQAEGNALQGKGVFNRGGGPIVLRAGATTGGGTTFSPGTDHFTVFWCGDGKMEFHLDLPKLFFHSPGLSSTEYQVVMNSGATIETLHFPAPLSGRKVAISFDRAGDGVVYVDGDEWARWDLSPLSGVSLTSSGLLEVGASGSWLSEFGIIDFAIENSAADYRARWLADPSSILAGPNGQCYLDFSAASVARGYIPDISGNGCHFRSLAPESEAPRGSQPLDRIAMEVTPADGQLALGIHGLILGVRAYADAAVTGLKLGTASTGEEIVAATDVPATTWTPLTGVDALGSWPFLSSPGQPYVSATDWGTATDLRLEFIVAVPALTEL